MFFLKDKSSWQIVFIVIVCLALGGGLGYWEGQRASHHEMAFEGGQIVPSLPSLPPNASPEMKEFLQNQETLSQKMQQARGPGGNGTLSPPIFALFRQQNADLLKRQNQLAQIIAQQQQANSNLATPLPIQVPPNASPQLQTYLTAKDKLMRDQIEFLNQHKTDNLATQQAAMEQWRKTNASRIQQLQQMAQALPQVATATTK